MDDYIIIGWPEIQDIMDLNGFKENATLITPNETMDIGSSTYLVDKEWYYNLKFKNPKSEEEQIKELAELKNELLNSIK